MPPHPCDALTRALLAALRADASLIALLGGDRVYDALPQRPTHPHVAIGPVTVRDWSTSSGPGHRHLVTLTAVSREPGFRQVYALAGAIGAAVEREPLALDGHRPVLVHVEATEFRRDADGLTSRGAVTVRAFTEPTD